MMLRALFLLTIASAIPGSALAAAAEVTGELRQWHKVTLSIRGPEARETDTDPNPFLDYRLTVTFTHESGTPSYRVPGYFAADGDAGNSSAIAGNIWRAHVSPDKPGWWNYSVSFVRGKYAAIYPNIEGRPLRRLDGQSGSFRIAPTDKSGRDFRAHGRLRYVGQRYLQFAGSGEYFLKAGADSPENLLGYVDFDGTYTGRPGAAARANEAATPSALKTWAPHVRDWRPGDPTWKGTRGKGLIGALNYLSGKGANAISFLTYNAGGDGDDVWPFLLRDTKLHYDCSRLDQWQIVFDHAQRLGLYLHFKLQETEMDDNRHGGETRVVPTALDGGETGIERRLYLRELIARFGHALALNWNLGEENTQSTEQLRAMADYIRATDPYQHHIVVHTYPDQQDEVYQPLLGANSPLTGASLQNPWQTVHERVLYWINAAEAAGKPWVVANDEQNPHYTGVPPDPGYKGFSGTAYPQSGSEPYTLHDIRKRVLWGALMAGGAGVEYYFGYTLPENDLNCEDWRSRDQSWDYCRIALEFFRNHAIPFWEMRSRDDLLREPDGEDAGYCLAKPGEVYVIYLPQGGAAALDLEDFRVGFRIQWYNPRTGGALQTGSRSEFRGPQVEALGLPPGDPDQDWVAVVRKMP